MSDMAFSPADILLPVECEYQKWAVVACDQYTSQPEYWQRVENFVGSAPSALRLILPESCLDGPNVETDIMDINNTMTRYLREGRFRSFPNALVYVERTLKNGAVRRGLIGKIDLEQYDYEPGSETAVRATEGTVMSRIPPRVAVRKNAPIELPHVMLLCDDPQESVIEPLCARKDQMEVLYHFDLMEYSGSLAGWLVDEPGKEHIFSAFHALNAPEEFRRRYHLTEDTPVLQFAVGDGNHSLATAKECYERQKRYVSPAHWAELPSRYALCEVVNLHEPALQFEPIHRVLFDVQAEHLLTALRHAYPGAYEGVGDGHVLHWVSAEGKGAVTVPHPNQQLPVGTLQTFLDAYLAEYGGSIDYIHGADVAASLGRSPGNLAFLLSPMAKTQLFPTVIREGILPRKTFSMGTACDKRFYLEARRIR